MIKAGFYAEDGELLVSWDKITPHMSMPGAFRGVLQKYECDSVIGKLVLGERPKYSNSDFFNDCLNISSVVTNICDKCSFSFKGCVNIEELEISYCTYTVYPQILSNPNLKKVTIDKDHPYYRKKDGLIYRLYELPSQIPSLYVFFCDKDVTGDIKLDTNVSEIGKFAFANSHVKSVSGLMVGHIRNSAFAFSDVVKIDMPHLYEVGELAFRGCENFYYFNAPTVRYLDQSAFEESGLKILILPTDLEIKNGEDYFFQDLNTFSRCPKIEKIIYNGISHPFIKNNIDSYGAELPGLTKKLSPMTLDALIEAGASITEANDIMKKQPHNEER